MSRIVARVLAIFGETRSHAAGKRRHRVAFRPRGEGLEDRRLLAVYVTSLTGDAGGSYSNSASVSSQDLLGDTYRFTVGQGAAINVTVQSDASDPNAYFSVDLTDEPYGTAGDSNFYTGSGGTGTVTLATVTGDRSHYYYVSIQGSEFGSGTAVQLPYTVTITTGSGEPQPDLAINSATLNPYNNSVQYTYSATNDPGTYSIGVYLASTSTYVATSDDQPLATRTITTGTTSSSTGTLNFGSIAPTTKYPYLSVYINESLIENNYNNNVYSITLPPLKSPDVILNSASVSGTDVNNNDQRSVTINYSIVGSDLPTPETMNLYWATGPSLSNALPGGKAGSAYFLATRAISTPYTETIPFKDAALGDGMPPAATYVLALANPPYADSTKNFVAAQIAATPPAPTPTPTPTLPPEVSIVSFAKNISPNLACKSNGDYDVTYQVSGANLPANLNLTVAVYWATGLTEASIIPNVPPVATGQLQQAVGTYTFPVHITQLVSPPSNATNLIAVIQVPADVNVINNDETIPVPPLTQRIIDAAEWLAATNPNEYKYASKWNGPGGEHLTPPFYKCNIFVYDALTLVGVHVPLVRRISVRHLAIFKDPLSAAEWAGRKVPGFKRLVDATPQPGDIIINDHFVGRVFHDHMGIVDNGGTTISVKAPNLNPLANPDPTADTIVDNDFGFRSNETYVIQRPKIQL